jgi:hypothetical protein
VAGNPFLDALNGNATAVTPAEVQPANPFLEALSSGEIGRAQDALKATRSVNPDEAASNRKLAREVGIPEEAVIALPEEAMGMAFEQRNAAAFGDAPSTAYWFGNPRNAEVASDSVNQLTTIERLGRSLNRGFYQQEQSIAQFDAGFGNVGSAVASSLGLSPSTKEKLDAFSARLKQLDGSDDTGFAAWMGSAAEVVGQMASTLSRSTTTVAASTAAGAALGAPIAGVGAVPGAIVGFGVGLRAAMTADTFVAETGNFLENAQQLGIDRSTAKFIAPFVGTINAGIETVLGSVILSPFGLGNKQLAKSAVGEAIASTVVMTAAKRAAAAYGSSVTAEVGTEILQEVVQIVGEEVGKAFTDNETKKLTYEDAKERITEIAVKTFQAATVLAAPGTIKQYRDDKNNANRAITDRETLQQTGDAIRNSPLYARDPEAAIEHAQSVLPEVRVPAEELIRVITEREGDPAEALARLGVAGQVDKALAAGDDIILSPEAHARLHALDYAPDLYDHIRTDPNGFTAFEAKEVLDIQVDEEVAVDPEQKPAEPAAQVELTPETRKALTDANFTAEEIAGLTEEDIRSLLGPNPEMPQNFARAPDEAPELSLAEAQIGLQFMLRTAKDAGMRRPDYLAFLVKVARAREVARNRFEDARLRAEKEKLTAEYQTVYEREREIAQQEIDQQPVYAALTSIGSTRLDRTAVAEALRYLAEGQYTGYETMDPARQRQIVEEVIFPGLPKVPGKGPATPIFTTKADKNGMDPALLAQANGFESAREMLEAMYNAKDRTQAIQERADERVKQGYPELLSSRSTIDEALEALHTDTQGQVLMAELNALRSAQKQGRVKYSLVKREARDRLLDKVVDDINPNSFFNAERRKSREAGNAVRKGDRDLAVKRKFEQVLNFEMARASYKAAKEMNADRKFAQKLLGRTFKRGADMNEAADFYDAAKLILVKYGFAEDANIRDETQAQQLALDIGFNGQGTSLQGSLKYAEWREMFQAVRQLVKQGNDVSTFTLEGQKVELTKVIEDLVNTSAPVKDAVQADPNKRTRGDEVERAVLNAIKKPSKESLGVIVDNMRNLEGLKDLLVGAKAIGDAYYSLTEFMMRRLDNGKVAGSWYNAVFKPMIDAGNKEQAMKAKLVTHMEELSKVVRENRGRELSTTLNGTGLKMDMTQRLMLALNMGNPSNADKLVKGLQSRPGVSNGSYEAVLAEMNALPPSALAWVQKTWDIFEAYRPQVETIYRAEFGVNPDRIFGQSIPLANGMTLRGGYFPMMYERDAIANKADNLKSDPAMARGTFAPDFVQATVYSGMTKARTEFVAPVAFDIGRMPLAMEQVFHYVSHYEAVKDVKKLLRSPPIKDVIQAKLGTAQYRILAEWADDIAAGGDAIKHGEMSNALSGPAEWMRRNIVIANLAYSINTLTGQLVGIPVALNQLGRNQDGSYDGANAKKRFSQAFIGFMMDKKAKTQFIYENSEFMRTRIITADQAIGEAMSRVRGSDGRMAEAARIGLSFIPKFQFATVDAPAWLAGFSKAIEQGHTQKQAAQIADSIVRTSQGSGTTATLSRAQRSTNAFLRLAMMFATAPVVLYNNLGEVGGDVSNKPTPKNYRAAASRLFDVIVVAGVVNALRQNADPDTDDEDFGWKWFARIMADPVSSIPVIGDYAGSALLGFQNADSAAATMVNAFKGLGVIDDWLSGDKEFEEVAPTIVKSVGTVFAVPVTAPLKRFFDAVKEDSDNPTDYIIGPPPK